ncbi:MAG TPA: hypothetical protein VMU34_23275 [Mycobacterium sp.]|nr:hypothetical protein [Mycobacterium sp.]
MLADAVAWVAKEAAFQLARAGKETAGGDRADRQHRHPRLIATEMVAAMPEKALTKVTSQIPAGPLGHRDGAARVVHCLAADAS